MIWRYQRKSFSFFPTLVLFNWKTRKSSCVNARDIPPADVLFRLGVPPILTWMGERGGYPRYPHPDLGRGYSRYPLSWPGTWPGLGSTLHPDLGPDLDKGYLRYHPLSWPGTWPGRGNTLGTPRPNLGWGYPHPHLRWGNLLSERMGHPPPPRPVSWMAVPSSQNVDRQTPVKIVPSPFLRNEGGKNNNVFYCFNEIDVLVKVILTIDKDNGSS